MTVALSNMRTLISFTGGNWEPVLENEIFQAIIKNPPEFWGLDYDKFTIIDMFIVNADESDNETRSGGTRLKKNDIEKGWDVSERPLIVVIVDGEYYLWDGFNRWWKLNDLGEVSAPVWLYRLKEGYSIDDVKEHVQLSANNSAKSDEHTKRDFINTGIKWAGRHNITDVVEIRDWVNRSEHDWTDKQVDQIAAQVLLESETTQVRHIHTGSKAKKEAYDFVDEDFTYGEDKVTNPIVVCTKVDDYIQDAFLQHMKKFVQDDQDGGLETTEIIGYTKGCETAEQVKKQREHAKKLFDELDELVCGYAFLKMKLNGKAPYEWKGFLPQLYDIEIGDGIAKKLWD